MRSLQPQHHVERTGWLPYRPHSVPSQRVEIHTLHHTTKETPKDEQQKGACSGITPPISALRGKIRLLPSNPKKALSRKSCGAGAHRLGFLHHKPSSKQITGYRLRERLPPQPTRTKVRPLGNTGLYFRFPGGLLQTRQMMIDFSGYLSSAANKRCLGGQQKHY